MSRRRDLRFPPCAFASQTSSLRIASLTPCFGVRLFLFPFRLPAPSPSFRPHRNLTSPRLVSRLVWCQAPAPPPRLVSGSRHLRPARCQAPPVIFVRTVISRPATKRRFPRRGSGSSLPVRCLFRRPGTGRRPQGGGPGFVRAVGKAALRRGRHQRHPRPTSALGGARGAPSPSVVPNINRKILFSTARCAIIFTSSQEGRFVSWRQGSPHGGEIPAFFVLGAY